MDTKDSRAKIARWADEVEDQTVVTNITKFWIGLFCQTFYHIEIDLENLKQPVNIIPARSLKYLRHISVELVAVRKSAAQMLLELEVVDNKRRVMTKGGFKSILKAFETFLKEQGALRS